MSSLTTMPTQQSPSWHIEGYKDMVLDEVSRLYDGLLKYLINSTMDNAVGASS
jgi:hypothetical protein